MNLIFAIILPFLSIQSDVQAPVKPEKLRNFHVVDDSLYRSGQPTRRDIKDLESMGVYTVINLRNVINDRHEVKGTGVTEVRIPMRAKKITYEDIVTTMCAIQSADKPVVIHCLHGSDRTGCMVAAYRMMNGMDKEEAISEFLDDQYGYNKRLFPNILELLKSIDPEQLKKDVNCGN